MRGVYIHIFDEISVKVSVLGVLYPYSCTDGGEIWHVSSTPIGTTCRPCGAKKTQNRPLSNLNIGRRFALLAMLPVKTQHFWLPRRRVKSDPTKLGTVIENLEHVLVPLKLLAFRRMVSPLGDAENFGRKPDHMNLKPHNSVTP